MYLSNEKSDMRVTTRVVSDMATLSRFLRVVNCIMSPSYTAHCMSISHPETYPNATIVCPNKPGTEAGCVGDCRGSYEFLNALLYPAHQDAL